MKPVRFGQGEDNFPSSEAECLWACVFISSRELTSFDCTNCAMTETEVSSYSCGDCGHVCSYMMELHVVHLGHKGSTGSGKQDTIFCSFAGWGKYSLLESKRWIMLQRSSSQPLACRKHCALKLGSNSINCIIIYNTVKHKLSSAHHLLSSFVYCSAKSWVVGLTSKSSASLEETFI